MTKEISEKHGRYSEISERVHFEADDKTCPGAPQGKDIVPVYGNFGGLHGLLREAARAHATVGAFGARVGN